MLLDSIKSPEDVKKLNYEDLEILSEEIRKEIIHVTSENGGHVGPNLGVVELTIALHRIFDTPKDNIQFDVSHQSYVHKLLTGRNGKAFRTLRQGDGVCGFSNRKESPHDSFGAGHAGTCLSASLGMAVARDLNGGDEHVVAVCGDAAFTCGHTMEALNNIASSTKRLIVILNDNEWSISKNVGALSKSFNELITNPIYNKIHTDVESLLAKIPGGESLIKMGSKAKKEAKDFLVPSCLFEHYDLRFVGPIDGHNLKELEYYLEFAKQSDEPILLHVITQKGKGYDIARKFPEKFHGASPYDVSTGKSKGTKESRPKYQDVFGKYLTKFAQENEKIVAITAAMASGTGLNHFEEKLPKRFFDVGIAEGHAVIFAAGLATKGIKPVCAIYSTFLQRAIDSINHDVCLQNLPIVFCMDRSGLSPNDGPTHHGLFDISYLRSIPNTIIMQAKDEDELVDMLFTALDTNSPTFIRIPRGNATGKTIKDEPIKLEIGKAQEIKKGTDVVIWALGNMVSEALAVAKELEEAQKISVGVVNARFAKPIDKDLLIKHSSEAKLIVTLEDHVQTGGFGSSVAEILQHENHATPVEIVGWPDKFIPHGDSVSSLRALNGLSVEQISEKVLKRLQNKGQNIRSKVLV